MTPAQRQKAYRKRRAAEAITVGTVWPTAWLRAAWAHRVGEHEAISREPTRAELESEARTVALEASTGELEPRRLWAIHALLGAY